MIDRRDAALSVAIGEIERQSGRGAIPKVSWPQPERPQSAQAKVATGKPRDAKGHFIKRRAPEAAPGLAPASADTPPPTARSPRLLQIDDELAMRNRGR